MAAAPATNCSSISAYATAWLPLVLRHAALIWSTIACTASPTALSSSGISSTICIVGHPPSLGLLLPLRCHGSAPLSTATPLCFLIALRLLLRIGATPNQSKEAANKSFSRFQVELCILFIILSQGEKIAQKGQDSSL